MNSEATAIMNPPRRAGLSPIGLAALVTAIHVSLMGRPTSKATWSSRVRPVVTHREPGATTAPDSAPHRAAPSHPVQRFCVGQLSLTCGMAVVTLAVWLHIMHLSGVVNR